MAPNLARLLQCVVASRFRVSAREEASRKVAKTATERLSYFAAFA